MDMGNTRRVQRFALRVLAVRTPISSCLPVKICEISEICVKSLFSFVPLRSTQDDSPLVAAAGCIVFLAFLAVQSVSWFAGAARKWPLTAIEFSAFF
jgi:hypothetical protein